MQLPFSIFTYTGHTVSLPIQVTFPSQWCPKGPADVLAAPRGRSPLAPSVSDALRDLIATSSGQLKGWKLRGRPLFCLSCLQSSHMVSQTALLTAAGPTQKEAVALKLLIPNASWQHPKTGT